MPIGDLDDVPIIGKNVVIAILVQSHILIATFILGASLHGLSAGRLHV